MLFWTLRLDKDLIKHQYADHIYTYTVWSRFEIQPARTSWKVPVTQAAQWAAPQDQGYVGYILEHIFPRLPVIPSCPLQNHGPFSVPLSLPVQWGHLGSASGNVYEAPLDFCLEGLWTVMHAWFKRWLQENGGEGRVPNMASAFIFDIIKRSPGQGPDWSLLEYKMQTCAFCWWGASMKAPHVFSQHFVSIGCRIARKSIWVPVILCRVSDRREVGQKKSWTMESGHVLSSPPSTPRPQEECFPCQALSPWVIALCSDPPPSFQEQNSARTDSQLQKYFEWLEVHWLFSTERQMQFWALSFWKHNWDTTDSSSPQTGPYFFWTLCLFDMWSDDFRAALQGDSTNQRICASQLWRVEESIGNHINWC